MAMVAFSLWNFNAVLSIATQVASVNVFPEKKKGKKQKKNENGNCDNKR